MHFRPLVVVEVATIRTKLYNIATTTTRVRLLLLP